ncbi:hypothetical protein E2C01_026009 [Portunus trituberculatus]|uniref:Uncharacterized protein n=1 Tax=Portunus trituberculatus TaxID=210409 RepID=A0A5B7EJI1_PORTR|nr:hypothetical protein [Portunus trituberculatus]
MGVFGRSCEAHFTTLDSAQYDGRRPLPRSFTLSAAPLNKHHKSRVQVVLLACKEDMVSPAFLIESDDLKIVEKVDGIKMVASNAISFLASRVCE